MDIIVKSSLHYQKYFRFSNNFLNTEFRLSSYILQQNTMEGMLFCNTLTGELVLLNVDEKERIDALPGKLSNVLMDLAYHRFIVPISCEEVQVTEQLRSLLMKRMEAKRIIDHYNILPTTYCNARCFYCYESGIKHTYMSEKTVKQLIEFIETHSGNSKVRLSWFGGEPMMGKQRIDEICLALDERNIDYESDMTSNGYLFDITQIEHAKNVWHLKTIQITLDGTEEVYNRTKAYNVATGSPYRCVIQNIGLLAEAEIYVNIRLNLDSHNVEDLQTLIEELSSRFKGKEYISVYIRQLYQGTGFEPIQHNQNDIEYLDRRLNELQAILESKGWSQFKETRLPRLRVACCMADDPRVLQCTPEGILSKCEDQIYNHTIGTLKDGIFNKQELLWWQARRTFDGCKQCPLYPSCSNLLKNCPVTKKCTDYDREHRIARYKELMLQEYEKWKSKGN